MIDLQTATVEDRENYIRRIGAGKYAKGAVFKYHEGDYSDSIGTTWLGAKMRELFHAGKIDLFQKLIQTQPRKYIYMGVMK